MERQLQKAKEELRQKEGREAMEHQQLLYVTQSMKISAPLLMNKSVQPRQITNVQQLTSSSVPQFRTECALPPSPRSARVTARENVEQSLTPSMNRNALQAHSRSAQQLQNQAAGQ